MSGFLTPYARAMFREADFTGLGQFLSRKISAISLCSDCAVSGSMKRKPTSKKMSNTRSTHPLVGTWTQEKNSVFFTPVVYTVSFKDGRFVISGVDESDGVALEISNVRWDGECLRFVSLFAPTNHKAKHALRLIGKDKISHKVVHSSEEGPCTDDERWERRPQRRKRSER